ncbi:MAG: FtsX-like permease family protein [Planctomycetes bacterium]|nr:FtsX-like permease family protein [Planctomycetota bacterium]
MKLLLRQGLRHHQRHALQTLLTVLGIAAGVALLCAMQLAQRTAEHAFELGLQAVAGSASHTVTAGPEGLPVASYVALRARLGGRAVAPSVSGIVRVPGRGERTVLRALGIDPLADVELRPWSSPAAGEAALPLGEMLTRPGAFVATAPLLARLGVRVGDELRVTMGGRPLVAHCVGTIAPAPIVAAGLADVLVVDIATAQEWTQRTDRIDRLDLRLDVEVLPDGLTPAAALAAVAEELGPGAHAVAVGMHQGGLAQLARGFRINLRALCLLSLLVGAFLVHETMRLSVVARRRSFGVLRALGVQGGALGRVVAIEAGLLGLIGSAAGALLGIAFAHLLLEPLVRTLNDHYATFELQRVEVDPLVLAVGVVLGCAVAVLAGLGPAIAASRVPPRDVLVPQRHAAQSGRHRGWRIAIPAAALAYGLLITTGDRLPQAYVGILAMLVAAVALVPIAMELGLRGLGRLVGGAGPFVRYVVRSTATAREHLALPVAAMVLALATTIGLASLVGSFRDSVTGWLLQVLPADVYVSVPGGVDERVRAVLEPAVIQALRQAPEVAGLSTYQRTRMSVRGGRGEGEIDICGMAPTGEVLRSFAFVGNDQRTGRDALLRGTGAWVSESLAFRWGLSVGEVLVVRTAKGPVDLPIAAVHRDYSNERGEVLVGASWLDAQAQVGVTAIALQAEPGTEVEPWVLQLRARTAAASEQDVQIRSQNELRTSSLAIFDRTFAITGVMRLLCLLVAFFGIYAAFASLQLERGAEIGLLRCLGARPRQIGFVVLGQTALLGLCAGLLAIPVGALLGHVLANVINRVSFGWSLAQVEVPASAVAEVIALAVLAALAAGLQPALRFARMRPADALRES